MASKYDAYWGGQLHRIREGLQLAVTGAAAVVSVPDLARLGERQSWHGIAEVRGQELINSSGAHVTSLGRQIAASGICQQWPQRTFRFMIGTDGGVLTITLAQKDHDPEIHPQDNSPEIHPPRVFMSYRRDDTDYPAAWLFAELARHFDKGQVFKDVDSIEPGDDFVEVITSAVASCDVLLALIGRRWLTVTGEDGRRRLDDPGDFVRLEIEAALTRNVRVIPVLVEAAQMPREASALPEGECVRLGAGLVEGDLERSLADPVMLAYKLIQAAVPNHAVSVLVDVDTC